MKNVLTHFPAQKKTQSQKTKKWYKECVDAVDQSGFLMDEGVRASWKEKVINVNLYNGQLDPQDIVKTLNPDGWDEDLIGTDMQHYPVANSRLDVLIGEESKRIFPWRVLVTNSDAISEKEEQLNYFIKERVRELIESNYEEDELKRKLAEFDKDLKNYQDKRELRATRLLKHLWHEQLLGNIFNRGFKDVVLQGEEYYEANIVSGEPMLFKIDPQHLFWTKSGFSNKVSDANLIMIDQYWSPGRVLDHYHGKLKDKDLKKLETGFSDSVDKEPFVDKKARAHVNVDIFDSNDPSDAAYINNLIRMGSTQGYQLSEPYDASGNVRVLRVYWKGWRKVQKVTYFDEFGEPQEDIFPENYIPKADEGEVAETLWINEWYEGTKIGEDIYVDLRPKPLQYRKMTNPSYCHPGIVGKTYSINSNQTVSLMSKVKNFLYLYDAIHDRLNKISAANQGKIFRLDTAGIPAELGPTEWFHYLKKMKIAIFDSFKEGNKGAARGKLYGGLNNNRTDYIDLDTSQAIESHIAFLQFIKLEIAEMTGVTDQRLGQISNRETVGGVERSVTQSNHITEWYFTEHDEVKIEALRILLETAKVAYKGKNKKIQYILDDGSIQLANIDGDELNEADYGVVVTTSAKAAEAEQNLKRLAEVALNAGKANFSTVASIYLSDSIADIRRRLERDEMESAERERQAMQAAEDTKRQEIAQKADSEQKQRDLEERNNVRDNQTKLAVESMKQVANGDNVEQPEDNTIDYLKIDEAREQFYAKLQQENEHFIKKLRQDDKKIAVQARKSNSN